MPSDSRVSLRVFVEPQQGATYAHQLAVAGAAEDLGYEAFFRSDHYLKMGDVSGLPGPTDAWLTLAGLARETSSIRLGTLLTSVTFRHLGPLAISLAQVDEMSGGRLDVGLGAGWYEDEHTAYGIPFPPLGERFDLLEDTLGALEQLWSAPAGETLTVRGKRIDLVDSPGLPKPVQSPPPVIVGGHGKKRTPALAARFADEFNVPFADVDTVATQYRRVDEACAERGRAPEEIIRSAALVLCCGRDEAEIARRADAIGREADELRTNGAAGTPAEVVEKIGRYAEIGARRIYLQLLDMSDLDHLDLVASEVARQL
ncbi:LLM class F420-dependent oxidoreductase [Dietzia cinnamea]|uniref:FMN binding monooxygenase n=1 Tax=Dietzia sp. (strain D5) TaxID=1408143 RepID=W0C9W5_DIESD|nr:LLM class F420-dependent oxidoreductase [Dietzia cinnamea]AHE80563.1 FMN binding monooxygenase [Dietzia sp. D5]MCT2059741.1 LLM class F420-dependent oxidoreductase [Dietzia cinnamea]MCT2138904.1 LLM class F420-dependent oxidoreductase [Dietzia cinnamea]